MHPTCPRCGFELQPIDDAPPPFCAQCGLPQLRVSPDAQAYPTPSADAEAETPTATAPNGRAISHADWPKALRLISVATLLGVIPPAALPGALSSGALAGPALLFVPVLTLGVVVLYHRSKPPRSIHGGIGARIGALLGLVMGSLAALITGIAGFVLRYHFHSHTIDDKINQAAAQLPPQLATAGPVPPEVLSFLQSPEFRAGVFLLTQLFYIVLLVMVGSVCGWLTGAMLKARRDRGIGL